MHSTLSSTQGRPSIPQWLSSNQIMYGLIFVVCVVAGYATPVVYQMGGLNLVACAMTGLIFATLFLLNIRWAIFCIFAFSLFQPIVTRLIFSVDFPSAPEESMLDYKDLLTTAVSLLLIVSAFVGILYYLSRGHRETPHVSALVYTIIAFTFLNGLQVFNPENSLSVGIYGAKNNVLPFLMFFAGMATVRTDEQLATFIKFIAGFSLVALLYGLYQEWAPLPSFESHWFSRTIPATASMFLLFAGDLEIRDILIADRIELRVPSVFQGYTFYSYIIVAFGLILYASAATMRKRSWKILRYAVLGALLLYFVVSLERAAIVMFVAGVIAIHFVHSRERRRFARFVAVGGLVTLISIMVLYRGGLYLQERGAIEGNSKLIRIFELTDPLNAVTVTFGRIQGQWPKVMSDIRESPITGTGTGTAMYTRATDREDLVMPLSQFLQEWTELGLFGLLLFVASLVFLYQALTKVAMDPKEPPIRHAYAAGMIGVTVAYSLCGIFNVPFVYEPGIVFWFLAGTAIGVRGPRVQTAHSNTPASPTLAFGRDGGSE